MEEAASDLDDAFMKKGILLIVDGLGSGTGQRYSGDRAGKY